MTHTHQPTRSELEELWDATMPSYRHRPIDGRRAVLHWVEGVGTVLTLIDGAQS